MPSLGFATGRMKTALVYPPPARICGSGKLAFAHSSNINLMPRPHVSTILREYITFAIVGLRSSLMFPARSSALRVGHTQGRADLRVGQLRLGLDSARPSRGCLTLSIMPLQHIHFILIRPGVCIGDKPPTHRVVPYIFPLCRITVTRAELGVPAVPLPQWNTVRNRKCPSRQRLPIVEPTMEIRRWIC